MIYCLLCLFFLSRKGTGHHEGLGVLVQNPRPLQNDGPASPVDGGPTAHVASPAVISSRYNNRLAKSSITFPRTERDSWVC